VAVYTGSTVSTLQEGPSSGGDDAGSIATAIAIASGCGELNWCAIVTAHTSDNTAVAAGGIGPFAHSPEGTNNATAALPTHRDHWVVGIIKWDGVVAIARHTASAASGCRSIVDPATARTQWVILRMLQHLLVLLLMQVLLLLIVRQVGVVRVKA
jgi:hypothetical protein